jgi:hypothetical protein
MSNLERIRAYVDGTLPQAERAAFEADLARDRELAEMTEAYGYVVRATADDAPVPATAFEDLPLTPRRTWRRPVLAAAAVLLIAAGAAIFWPRDKTEPAPGYVRLASIPLREVDVPPQPPALPEGLADHRTAGDDGLIWIRDLERGQAIARAAGRPVLLFIDHPTCPICAKFEAGPFRDENVEQAAAAFVLVRASWNTAPKQFVENPNLGWPIFVLLDHEGKRIDGFKSYKSAPELARWLTSAREAATGFRYPEWDEVRRLARLLASDTYEALDEVAHADPDGELGDVARWRLANLAADARAALLAARAAPKLLDEAIGKFQGTPYAADLEAVRSYVAKHGKFPELR